MRQRKKERKELEFNEDSEFEIDIDEASMVEINNENIVEVNKVVDMEVENNEIVVKIPEQHGIPRKVISALQIEPSTIFKASKKIVKTVKKLNKNNSIKENEARSGEKSKDFDKIK